jgi:hypothetical protein
LDQPNMWHVKDMTPNPNQIKLPQCHWTPSIDFGVHLFWYV